MPVSKTFPIAPFLNVKLLTRARLRSVLTHKLCSRNFSLNYRENSDERDLNTHLTRQRKELCLYRLKDHASSVYSGFVYSKRSYRSLNAKSVLRNKE